MLAFVGIILVGGGVWYLGWNIFSGELEGASANRLEQSKKSSSSLILKLSRPVFRSFVLPYSERIKAVDWRKKVKRQIISAGLEDELDGAELLAFKIFLGFIVPAALEVYLLIN